MISHIEVQDLFRLHGRVGFMNALNTAMGQDVIRDYNNFDVAATVVIFDSYVKAWKKIPFAKDDPNGHPCCFVSISSMMYKFAEKHWKNKEIPFHNLNYAEYEKIRKASYGARTDVFESCGKVFNEAIVSLDTVSQYPTMMFVRKVNYPCGALEKLILTSQMIESLMTQFRETNNLEKIGIYSVNIDQTFLINRGLPVMIPRKEPHGNNWNVIPEVLKQYNIMLCSIDILELLRQGCTVKFIEDSDCYVFADVIDNFSVFGFLSELMELKMQMDDEIAKGNLNGNAKGIRTVCKTASNALSGKCMEIIHAGKVIQVNSHHFYSQIALIKNMKLETMECLGMANQNTVIVKYQQEPDTVTNIKHAYLTMVLYAYARREMYHVIKKLPWNERIMVDTDSFKCTYRAYQQHMKDFLLRNLIPHNEHMETIDARYKDSKMLQNNSNKIFGTFVHELDRNNNRTFVVAKKCYGVFRVQDGQYETIKLSLRSIKTSAIVVLDYSEIEHFTYETLIDNKPGYGILDKAAAFEYVKNNQHRTINDPKTAHDLFQAAVRGEFAVTIGFFINIRS